MNLSDARDLLKEFLPGPLAPLVIWHSGTRHDHQHEQPRLTRHPLRTLSYTLILVSLMVLSACITEPTQPSTPVPTPLASTTSMPTHTSAPPTPTSTAEPSATTALPTPTIFLTPVPSPSMSPIPHLATGQPVAISSIHMVGVDTGWAVGGNEDHILHTSDGGQTWRDVTPPQPLLTGLPPDVTFGGEAIGFFRSADSAWVVYGYYPSLPRPPYPLVWRTQDGGQTWQPSQPLPGEDLVTFPYFVPVVLFFADDQHGWFIATVQIGDDRNVVRMYATMDGGLTWESLIGPDEPVQDCWKTGLAFADAQSGWLTRACLGSPTEGLLFRTDDGGRSWQAQSLPPPRAIPDLFTRADAHCGAYSPAFFASGSGVMVVRCVLGTTNTSRRYLYITSDGGQAWRARLMPPCTCDFWGPDPLVMLKLGVGWVLSATGTDFERPRDLYRTIDGGWTWEKLKTAYWHGQLDFITEQVGWGVVRSRDAIALVQTVDGGLTWRIVNARIAP